MQLECQRFSIRKGLTLNKEQKERRLDDNWWRKEDTWGGRWSEGGSDPRVGLTCTGE